MKPTDALKKLRNKTESLKAPHVEVQALAGTGKTTTIIEGLCNLRGISSSIEPSPQQREVWESLKQGDSFSIRLCAFNTSISKEMKERVQQRGLSQHRVEVKGIHGLGYGAVLKQFGGVQPSVDSTRERILGILGKTPDEVRRKPELSAIVKATNEVASLAKQTLANTEEELENLIRQYDIDVGEEEEYHDDVIELVPKVLDACLNPSGHIHFDDQVWLPVVLNLPIYRTSITIVDESQDLNRAQQELVLRSGNRIIYVGDRHQAIYAFAGADSKSMDRLAEGLKATPQGLKSYPLTVTRRCSKAVVKEANKYVKGYESHGDNPDGIVDVLKYPIQGTKEDRQLLPWGDTYGARVEKDSTNTMVLCRYNAPLVSQCLSFLAKRIPATILGGEIVKRILKILGRCKDHYNGDDVTTEVLIRWTQDYSMNQVSRENAKRFPDDKKIQSILDTMNCVVTLSQEESRLSDVESKISTMFTDRPSEHVVRFSSIHRAKGLEANKVYLLEPPNNYSRRTLMGEEAIQENNLRYVAITRSKHSLFYVR